MNEQTIIDEQNRFRPRVLRLGARWIIQCPGFRCLAIRDKDGKWWDANTDEELTDVDVATARQL